MNIVSEFVSEYVSDLLSEHSLEIRNNSTRRALPGESLVNTGAGAPPMGNLALNWASGIPSFWLEGKERGRVVNWVEHGAPPPPSYIASNRVKYFDQECLSPDGVQGA